jgi:ectonucleotide pyrophosphatase/phosphodiesterase family protein 5
MLNSSSLRVCNLVVGLVAFLALCGVPTQQACAQPPANATPLILISIDGFRADYLDRGLSPNLLKLAQDGVRAKAMRPAFPSITFPNHFTIVTGLYPDHHGIIDNTFEDAALPGKFHMSTTDEAWWAGATPIWISAEQQGVRTATEFWPGSEVSFHGIRPEHWEHFDHAKSGDARVDSLLAWLDLPAAERPHFLTLYFDIVDGAGHLGGPDSPQVDQAIAKTDASIGHLLDGLRMRHIDADLIVLADHGMIATSPQRTIVLDDLVDLKAARPVFIDAVAGFDITPGPAGEEAQTALLRPQPHMSCSRKQDLPARLHYGTNARIPAIICLAEPGYLIETRARIAEQRSPLLGEHGYDPATPEMAALFIADGPDFRRHLLIEPFDNVDVYPLMVKLLGIRGEPNDGNATTLSHILIPSAGTQ